MSKQKKEKPLKINGTLDEVLKAAFKGKPNDKEKGTKKGQKKA
ncbi:hypothetical protein RT717_26645 [Imperialibacter roseus]|uniref:Uncharacterized protein n=1 Tax=Imperialibacter roseus TaxID=1324217 RepID=A0ABZ0IQ66_9BACT|nr:hypothetical protein [Imperialibacter roseus]WOK06657.1 hypothetical protein RT717_26645 [Imperialibacter roseus]